MSKMITKANSDGIGYASKTEYEWDGKTYEADLQDGDKVKIISEVGWEKSNYSDGEDYYMKIETRNGEKKAKFNQSSINVLIAAYGDESDDWIGKEVNILTKKGVWGGKKGIACYFVVDGWYLDDFGDLVNDVETPNKPISTPDTMPSEVREAQELDPEKPPF